MVADVLLSRLDGVRRCGRGWIAKCPAHEDSSASLSISAGDDRTLLHCFAGCGAADVVAAVGLALADLFPERLASSTSEQRLLARRFAREADWSAALSVLGTESTIVLVCANSMFGGSSPSGDDLNRLGTAIERIESARAVLR